MIDTLSFALFYADVKTLQSFTLRRQFAVVPNPTGERATLVFVKSNIDRRLHWPESRIV
jgi:hypothetical protein